MTRLLVAAAALALAGCGGTDEQAATTDSTPTPDPAPLERPGLYLVSLDGKREFVTDDLDDVERWQDER